MNELDPPSQRPGPSTTLWLLAALVLIGGVAFVAIVWNYRKPASAASHWQGRVNYVVLCESAAPGSPGLDITSAMDEMILPSLPQRVDLTIVVSLTADRPRRRYQVAKLDPGADPAQGQVQELRFTEIAGHPSVTALLMPGLLIEQPGEMKFRVRCDGQAIAERVLVISVKGGAESRPAVDRTETATVGGP